MTFRKLALAASAVSLAVSPAAFAADRVAAPISGESEFAGENDTPIIILLALAAVTIGIFAADGGDGDFDDDDDEPVSI